MPLISRKRKLVDDICKTALLEMLEDDFRDPKIFDNAVEDVLAVISHRYSVPRQLVPKSDHWYTTILPSYPDVHFKHFLRVSRADFHRILQMIENCHVFQGANSHKQFPVEQQLAITLNKFGNDGTGSGIMKTGALFGVGGGGSVMKITTRVIQAILTLENDWIRWPDQTERDDIAAEMQNTLPNCMGYIDGSHVNLDEAPLDDPESYFTRKQRYAIQIQAVCDNNKIIRNIFLGYPGSVHDSRIFTTSAIGRNPQNFLTNGQWLAGDSAYKNSDYMVTPFRSNATTGTPSERKRFNKYFSGFRVKIECTFGILKEVFASLKGLRIRVDRDHGHKLACNWIRACAILYNIIRGSIDENDYNYEIDDNDVNEEPQANSNGNDNKRKALFTFLNEKFN